MFPILSLYQLNFNLNITNKSGNLQKISTFLEKNVFFKFCSPCGEV